MSTQSELEQIREELWRMRRDLEDQIEHGRDAQNPWQVMEQNWDEIRRRVEAKDDTEETKQMFHDFRDRWEKLRARRAEQRRSVDR